MKWDGKKLDRLPVYILSAVLSVTALVFIAAWVVMDGGFQRAWEILLGLRSPYGQASGLGVVLSALGYLAVPTVIGLGIVDGVTRFTERRLLSDAEVEDEAKRIVERHRKKPASPQKS